MDNTRSKLTFTFLLVALTACAPIAVRTVHSPFYPSSHDLVEIVAEADTTDGVAEISIFQQTFEKGDFCAAYVAGKCIPLPTPRIKDVKTCKFEDNPVVAQCRATIGPFSDGAFVTYGAKAKNNIGFPVQDAWIGFSVGKQADSDEPIAVYTRGNSDNVIDIVFVPVDYAGSTGRTYRDFVNDVRRLVVDEYLAHPQVTDSRRMWNFYINPVTGGLLVSNVSGKEKRSIVHPTNWAKISALGDAAAFIHNNPNWRDFSNFNDAGVSQFTTYAPGSGIATHETGHAVFGLSDEYCCDGGIIRVEWPHKNLFDDRSSCQSSAATHSVLSTNCQQLGPTAGFCGGTDAFGNAIIGKTDKKWRLDVLGDLMGCGPGSAGGVLDIARIHWYYEKVKGP